MATTFLLTLDQEEHIKTGHGEETGPLICGLIDDAPAGKQRSELLLLFSVSRITQQTT